MNFHALMPFYRQHLAQELTNHFNPMDLIWHPICDAVDIMPFLDNTTPWIQPELCPALVKEPKENCYKKINDFLDSVPIIDEDYYGFIHDDDMYVPGFIDKVRQQTAGIIIYSASRGQNWPTADIGIYNWPPYPLIINGMDDIQVAKIDFCQMIVRGDIFRQTRFGYMNVCDDGHYAENLKKQWPEEILILPEIGINFNYFQPGRYTDK